LAVGAGSVRPRPPSLYTFPGVGPGLGSGLPPPGRERFPRVRPDSRGGFPTPVLNALSPKRLPIPPLQHRASLYRGLGDWTSPRSLARQRGRGGTAGVGRPARHPPGGAPAGLTPSPSPR
jgi:hypothetical protein